MKYDKIESESPSNTKTNSAQDDEMPIPSEGIVATHLLIVRDVARSRSFYRDILGARVLRDASPAILRFFNTWLILSPEGEATDDRPGIEARVPGSTKILTSALNLRVADIHDVYDRWLSRGAEFLTPPKQHSSEIRCYLRDPDGHLIEVGQTLGVQT